MRGGAARRGRSSVRVPVPVSVAAAVLGVVAVACAGGSSSPARPSAAGRALTIGALYPLSGPQGGGGQEEERGAQLAVELANSRGGVRGHLLRLDAIDVPSGGLAPDAIDQFASRGERIVIGTHGSTISAPASVAAARDGLLLWETGAVGETAPGAAAGDHFFRLSPMGAHLGRTAVDFVVDAVTPRLAAHRPLRYAVTYVDDAYGRSVGLGAVDEVSRRGQVLAGSFAYQLRGFDAAALVAGVAAVHPDVLVVSAYIDDGVALRQATVASHLPLLASIGTSSSYCMPAFGQRLGPGAVGLFASDKPDGDYVPEGSLTPEARTALDWARGQYQARWGVAMSSHALAGFANTWALVAHVLPAAGAFDPTSVARAAVATKLPLGSLPNGSGIDLPRPGQLDAGENRAAASVIWEWVAPGTRAVVWPPAFATQALKVLPIS